VIQCGSHTLACPPSEIASKIAWYKHRESLAQRQLVTKAARNKSSRAVVAQQLQQARNRQTQNRGCNDRLHFTHSRFPRLASVQSHGSCICAVPLSFCQPPSPRKLRNQQNGAGLPACLRSTCATAEPGPHAARGQLSGCPTILIRVQRTSSISQQTEVGNTSPVASGFRDRTLVSSIGNKQLVVIKMLSSVSCSSTVVVVVVVV